MAPRPRQIVNAIVGEARANELMRKEVELESQMAESLAERAASHKSPNDKELWESVSTLDSELLTERLTKLATDLGLAHMIASPQETEDLKHDLAETKRRLSSSSAEKTAFGLQIETLQSQVAKAAKGEKAFREKLRQVRGELSTASDASADLERRNSSLEGHLTVASAEKKILEQENEGLRADLSRSSAEKTALGQQLRHFEQELLMVSNEKTGLERQAKALQSTFDRLHQIADSRRSKINRLQGELSQTKESLGAKTNEATELLERIETLDRDLQMATKAEFEIWNRFSEAHSRVDQALTRFETPTTLKTAQHGFEEKLSELIRYSELADEAFKGKERNLVTYHRRLDFRVNAAISQGLRVVGSATPDQDLPLTRKIDLVFNSVDEKLQEVLSVKRRASDLVHDLETYKDRMLQAHSSARAFQVVTRWLQVRTDKQLANHRAEVASLRQLMLTNDTENSLMQGSLRMRLHNAQMTHDDKAAAKEREHASALEELQDRVLTSENQATELRTRISLAERLLEERDGDDWRLPLALSLHGISTDAQSGYWVAQPFVDFESVHIPGICFETDDHDMRKEKVPPLILRTLSGKQPDRRLQDLAHLWRFFGSHSRFDSEKHLVLSMVRGLCDVLLDRLSTLTSLQTWVLFHLLASVCVYGISNDSRASDRSKLESLDRSQLSTLSIAGAARWEKVVNAKRPQELGNVSSFVNEGSTFVSIDCDADIQPIQFLFLDCGEGVLVVRGNTQKLPVQESGAMVGLYYIRHSELEFWCDGTAWYLRLWGNHKVAKVYPQVRGLQWVQTHKVAPPPDLLSGQT